MEDLLRYITANPFLLFLIIGAILSFFQKGKEQENKKQPNKTNRPAGTGRQEVDWREIFHQEIEPNTAPQKQRKETYTINDMPKLSLDEVNQSNKILEKYEQTKRKKEAAKRYERKLKDSPIYQGDITAQSQVKLDFSNISREDAIKGVVWSEILGKPRAKGSYRPTLNTRRKKG
ncbi:hypothetical protein BKP45_05500 [Anaerobacillus alkalidiazotrophicus]|uniref:Uncharacterized protein n=1 Tax=Anaerobacillus alkalidiazotrophicus TaxID=472963 RepID=A0A1S2MBQ7_9BACI|nr:hypothetical protein [Anaerobacillus alkalidiazotrophicus]OIJ22129.1 hypothetical protein BKP45_05500 [Anaerobacillus alkalidiazotrophicus]